MLYVRYVPTLLSGGGGGGGGGSSGGIAIANLYDPIDTSLPTSAPLTIDGVLVTSGTTVLFSNLSSGNNEIYTATVTGPVVSWVVVPAFNGVAAPIAGDLVSIAEGTSFGSQVGNFNGTTWLFNDTVRYFNGTDYYEQSSINTSTLNDNTTNGTVFSLAYAGSENIMVNYSISRDGAKEAGTIPLTTDGTIVAIAVEGSATAATGVSFSAVISGSDLILQYTTTNTGSAGTMKYYIVRWSDAAGGPAGPPSYSGGGSSTAAAGNNGNIQFNGSGLLAANSNFSYDTANNLLLLGGVQESILNTTTFLDNQASPVPIITMPAIYNSVFIKYTIIRGTNVRSGRIDIATDGSIDISEEEYYAESGTTGLTMSVALSGGNIVVSYTSTSTGVGGTFKYAFDRW